MGEKVRIGFVGVGNMGQCAHLKNYATIPDCEIVALAELRPVLARRVAEKYGVPRVYTEAADMLANEKLDGIVAAQPFWQHGRILPELYQAGVPVFSEKPLAASLQVGEKLVEALRGGRSWHMVGYHKRNDPATVYARREIARLRETGELGNLTYVRISMPPGDFAAGGFTDLIRTDEPRPDLPGDPAPSDLDADGHKQFHTFVNYYSHQTNLLRFLLGESYRVTHADRSGFLLVAESASGATGVIELGAYRTTIDWQESALIAFQRGYLKLDLPPPLASNRPGRVEVFRDPGDGVTPTQMVPQLPPDGAMRQQALNFVRAIRGDVEPSCQAPEALEDLRVARDFLRLRLGV